VTKVWRIEAFNPTSHDRRGFSCGIPTIDNYLKLTARKLVQANMVRLWVAVAKDHRVKGFYAINAHAVLADDMPAPIAKKTARHGYIPAAFIAMMGVDRECQGRGLGSILLADALARIARTADDIGISVVLLDVFDCGDPERIARRKVFYEAFGFRPLPSRPLRLFLPIATIAAAIERAEAG